MFLCEIIDMQLQALVFDDWVGAYLLPREWVDATRVLDTLKQQTCFVAIPTTSDRRRLE